MSVFIKYRSTELKSRSNKKPYLCTITPLLGVARGCRTPAGQCRTMQDSSDSYVHCTLEAGERTYRALLAAAERGAARLQVRLQPRTAAPMSEPDAKKPRRGGEEGVDLGSQGVRKLRTLEAVRERSGALLQLAKQDKLEHFRVHTNKLDDVTDFVLKLMKRSVNIACDLIRYDARHCNAKQSARRGRRVLPGSQKPLSDDVLRHNSGSQGLQEL